jgi:hypothetical protein
MNGLKMFAVTLLLLSSFGFASMYDDFSTYAIGSNIDGQGCWSAPNIDPGGAAKISTFAGKNFLNVSSAGAIFTSVYCAINMTNQTNFTMSVYYETGNSIWQAIWNGSYDAAGAKPITGNGYSTEYINAAHHIYIYRNDTRSALTTAAQSMADSLYYNLSFVWNGTNFTTHVIYLGTDYSLTALNDTFTTMPYAGISVDSGRYYIEWVNITTTNYTPPGPAGFAANASVASALSGLTQTSFISGEPIIPYLTYTTTDDTTGATVSANVSMNLTGITYNMTLVSETGFVRVFKFDNITVSNGSMDATLSFKVKFSNATVNMTTNTTADIHYQILNITLCSSGAFMNFSFFNQSDITSPQLSDMEATFRYSYGDILGNFSFNLTNATSYAFCSASNFTNLRLSSVQRFSGSEYGSAILYYYLVNQEFNTSQTINTYLYPISLTVGVATRFTVYTGNAQPVANTFIQILRYYPSLDKLLLVSMGQTDLTGQAVSYLIPNTELYRYVLVSDAGAILLTTQLSAMICDPGATICDKSILIDATIPNEYTAYVGQMGMGCSYNNASGMLACTTNNPGGAATNLTLRVYEVNASVNALFCENSIGAGSGTVFCNNLNQSGKTFYYNAFAYSGGVPIPIGFGYVVNPVSPPDYGDSGILTGIGFTCTLAMLGIYAGPVGVLLGASLGFAISALLGFLPFSLLAISTVFAIAIIVGWILTRR